MLILVTNRKLCKDDFFVRIQQLAKGKPHAIMLREKDLNLADFKDIAVRVKKICEDSQVPLIINQNIFAAIDLNLPNIHLSMGDLKKYQNELHHFINIGASVHSISEAKEAQELGASYLIAGHIFLTDSKKGMPPRGLPFLKEVCDSVNIPVFAIGGITKDRAKAILSVGAKGMCIMSEAMTYQNPAELANDYHFE